MNDTLGLLLAILLIGVNAFFVGAEFSLISARRDRLEALAQQGKAGAVIVIRAGPSICTSSRVAMPSANFSATVRLA